MKRLLVLTVFFLTIGVTHAQEVLSTQTGKLNSINSRHLIGSSFFILGNLFPDPPSFYQLDYGYRLTQKDAVIIQAITWSYHAPLGIPYGPSFESDDESYPGSVRAYGVGMGYQRFLWKGFYSTVHATPFLQNFLDPGKEKIQQGFQLFLQLRLGYQLLFFNDQYYFEPSIAFNYWPINTNLPASFAKIENKWPNYFLCEPGLNFGIKF